MEPKRCCYKFGAFRLDTAQHALLCGDQVLHLTPKALDTLTLLVEHHGHLVKKDEILDQVWPESCVEEANVAKQVSILRKVLSENGLEDPSIETVPTLGYRFVAPIVESEGDSIGISIDPDYPLDPAVEAGFRPQKRKRKRIRALIPIAGLTLAFVVVAAGIWYYAPSFRAPDKAKLESTHLLLSTDDEMVQGGVISPDGKLVVFRRYKRGEKWTLAVRRLDGGEAIDLWNLRPNHAVRPIFSPDSKFIYYNRYGKDDQGIYRVSVSGGTSERIMAGEYSGVALSPDGNQMVFTRFYPRQTEGTVFVADKDGKNEKAISTIKQANYITQRLFSSNGRHVLIWEKVGEKHSARWVNLDDKSVSEAKELAPLVEQKWRHIRNLVLLKDGTGFLFSGKKTAGREQVYHLSLIDGKIVRLTDQGSFSISNLSVSDDRKTIVLTEGGDYSNMVSYDPFTKESRRIMNENRALATWWGGFSQMADGRILFSNVIGKGTDIYRMNKDGGNETRLTADAGSNLNPVATPDGKYIVFRSDRNGAENIWRMDSDGRNPLRLTDYLENELSGVHKLDIYNRSIQITKNGQTIFFAQVPHPDGESKLMSIPIVGGDPVDLLPNSPTSNFAPRISPDGKRLAYAGYQYDSKSSKAKFAIYVRMLNEDRIGKLEKTFAGNERRPIWTPDGKALTYVKQNGQDSDIWKIDLESGKETALTSFPTTNALLQYRMFNWASDGKKILIVQQIWTGADTAVVRNRDISKKLF